MNRLGICICLLLVAWAATAQTAHGHLKEGDRSYRTGNYTEAEESYRRSLLEENSTKGTYNLGNSVYQQERYEEAIKHYNDVLNKSSNNDVRSRAYHNLGNAHFSKQEFDKSVEAYKNSLRLQPNDLETKRNLTMAIKQMQLQQQQQQQQQSQEQQDEKEQDQQKDKQQQQQQDQQQPQQGNADDNSQPEDGDDKQPQEQEDLSKEEAQQLLQIMGEEERKVLEKMRKANSKPSKSDKDW
ncbi:MAG: tetratricopeptide repeat protein [Bacteroidota bacterium]